MQTIFYKCYLTVGNDSSLFKHWRCIFVAPFHNDQRTITPYGQEHNLLSCWYLQFKNTMYWGIFLFFLNQLWDSHFKIRLKWSHFFVLCLKCIIYLCHMSLHYICLYIRSSFCHDICTILVNKCIVLEMKYNRAIRRCNLRNNDACWTKCQCKGYWLYRK